MSDVDWWVGLVVVGDQAALDRGAELPVPPDASGQGQQPLGDADPDALDGMGAVAFQTELVFEGVEDRLDPLANAAQVAEPPRLISPVGADQPRLQLGDQLGEGAAGQAFVGQDNHARAQDLLAGSLVQQGFGDLAFPWVGLARHQATGRPSGLASTYSLSPQYQRLWLRS
jgi:hypothetical protein